MDSSRRPPASLVVAVLLALGAALLAAPSPALAATITVEISDDTFADEGDCDLREAIANANLPAGGDVSQGDCEAGAAGEDEIVFDPDTDGDPIVLVLGTLQIADDLRIFGNGPSATIVDGDDDTRVFFVDGATVEFARLTIRNGRDDDDGGGILNDGGVVTVTNSTLSGNEATGFGGGIYNDGGEVIVEDSTFSGNLAEEEGGGIFSGDGDVTITRSTFRNNEAEEYGGGVGNEDGTLTVVDSTFSGNRAGDEGGGAIDNYDGGDVTVTNSTFSGNSAGNVGGGIFNEEGSTVTVIHATFRGNRARFGGGIANGGGEVTLRATILADSDAGNCFNEGGTIQSEGFNISDDGSCDDFFTEDQRGVDRPVGLRCDSGAFEGQVAAEEDDDNGPAPADNGNGNANDNAVVEVFDPNNDDADERAKKTVTEERKKQQERTNRGSLDDVGTEGNVVDVSGAANDPPSVVIANRDGLVTVVLLGEARKLAPHIKVGDYLMAEGEKVHEQLFEAHEIDLD